MGYIPYELVICSSRLPVDLAFNLPVRDQPLTSHSQYVQNLCAERNKARFDQRLKLSTLVEGDHVLVQNVRLLGKNELEDKRQKDIYVVIKRSGDLPFYTVRAEADSAGKP